MHMVMHYRQDNVCAGMVMTPGQSLAASSVAGSSPAGSSAAAARFSFQVSEEQIRTCPLSLLYDRYCEKTCLQIPQKSNLIFERMAISKTNYTADLLAIIRATMIHCTTNKSETEPDFRIAAATLSPNYPQQKYVAGRMLCRNFEDDGRSNALQCRAFSVYSRAVFWSQRAFHSDQAEESKPGSAASRRARVCWRTDAHHPCDTNRISHQYQKHDRSVPTEELASQWHYFPKTTDVDLHIDNAVDDINADDEEDPVEEVSTSIASSSRARPTEVSTKGPSRRRQRALQAILAQLLLSDIL
ncbi:uncharacterized protein BYT42DRAFT_629673 [Radiomyces spectabilis]|uniref:uncharacterized protein n=1 Tax=Radiomyces spectabilis TaxID=64574 RepID=UPI00222113BC|nr:uncharacterized protein BYT42DRAFT_629673 [Radiomyces spectabilis]KAI8391723.1 hypothetical protein BYT42DRAFT_629673 [Radiomyces spectabilis]